MGIVRGNESSLPIDRLIEEFQKAKEFAETAHQRVLHFREMIVKALQEQGVPDHKGSLWIDAGDVKAKYEKRIYTSLDLTAIEEWAKENNLWEQVSETQEVVVEEKVAVLAFERPDLAGEINRCYKEKESWALKVVG